RRRHTRFDCDWSSDVCSSDLSILGFTLLATQAFVYNAVIFTFSLVLTGVFDVKSGVAGLYLIPFGIANFLGALLLGRLFDTVGRSEEGRVGRVWRRWRLACHL